MAEESDVVRRAEIYLQARGGPGLPPVRRVSFTEVGERVRGCDLRCEYAAVYEGSDGWQTPAECPGRDGIRSYIICEPCKDSWEHGDWCDLFDRCESYPRVQDLAYLSNDIHGYETALDYWNKQHGWGY